MTIPETTQLLMAVATLVSSLGAVAIGWHNSNKIEGVRAATDGMTTKLVDLTAKASNAEGKLEGLAEAKTEQAK